MEEQLKKIIGKGDSNAFKVPDGYFDDLPMKVMVKREVSGFKRTYWVWTSSIVSLGVVLLLFVLFGQKEESNSYYAKSFEEQEEYIDQEFTGEELLDYYLTETEEETN